MKDAASNLQKQKNIDQSQVSINHPKPVLKLTNIVMGEPSSIQTPQKNNLAKAQTAGINSGQRRLI
jgi:hypothetical protein